MKPSDHRILFLDIDGVLLPGRALTTPQNAPLVAQLQRGARLKAIAEDLTFDTTCLANLRRIVSTTGCQLVVISTWRKEVPDIIELLVRKGLERHWFHADPVAPFRMGSGKAHEVLFWLRGDRAETPDWLVLDDDEVFGSGYPDHHRQIRTNFDTGITDKDVLRVANFWGC
ncbi:MAG: HAD domain-containing protein [Motiliproteus sp.]|nr:HAD domain-containing protein [Motiliproteus sp.]MCW9053385.1 HAD domain-containing protein [Motiliproteus sp.]